MFSLVFACTSCSPLKTVVREHTDREVESAEESIHQDVQWKVEFEENFSSYDLGTEPDSLFILDGAYEVREESEQKGADPFPVVRSEILDSFSVRVFGRKHLNSNLPLSRKRKAVAFHRLLLVLEV